MAEIKLGNTTVNKIYLGSTEIKAAYLGSIQVWGSSPTPVEPEEGSIELSETTLTFDAQGGSKDIFVEASDEWTYENNQDWTTVNGTSLAKAKIVINPNTTGISRTGTIVFICGSAEKTLTIQQEG